MKAVPAFNDMNVGVLEIDVWLVIISKTLRSESW